MMKTFVTLAAFAAGSNALVGRGDSCCFHLTASGGASGSVGQLSDGQNRIGDNNLSPAQYCINSSGGITDGNGRGCILTPPTTQFQCDSGASPTTGFSVGSSGQLEYNGSPQFIACETGQNNGLNIYTKNSTDVTQCVNVNLKADSCSGSGSGAGASSSSVPAMSSSVSTSAQSAPASSAPASSAPASSAPASSVPASSVPASSAPASSAPASSAPSVPGGPVSSAQCLTGSPVTTTVTVTDCACATSGAPIPSGGGSYPSGSSSVMPSGPTGGGSYPSGSSSVMPSGPAGGSQPSTMTSVPASSASGSPSSATAHGSCPTTLSNGNYQYPHLIIPVDSASPNTAPGTSYNGTVTSSISSIFNFDIPQAYSDKTCSLVFLFPKKSDLETSSYSFSGDGKIDVSKLSDVASESTSYSNVPSVAQDLGDITISPGNSYVVSTFACPAGETIAFEMKNAGSTNLNFFEDWNPSPLGLFITSC